MFYQLAFLLILGAYENQRMCPNKVGIVSDMLAYPENEKFWQEAGEPVSLTEAIFAAIDMFAPKYLDVAVDGTLFPPEDDQHLSRWGRVIRKASAEIDLRIDDGGYSPDENKWCTTEKGRIAKKLLKGELPFTYSQYRKGKRVCLLTESQAKCLAAMNVQYGGLGLEINGGER